MDMRIIILLFALTLFLILLNIGYSQNIKVDTAQLQLGEPVSIPEYIDSSEKKTVNAEMYKRRIIDLIPEKILYDFLYFDNIQPSMCGEFLSDDSIKVDRILPIVICKVLPSYPDIAKRLGLSGNVTVRISVDTLGRTIDVEPIRCDIDLFAESVINAAKKWTFTPFYESDIAKKFSAELSFKFRLHNKRMFVIPPE